MPWSCFMDPLVTEQEMQQDCLANESRVRQSCLNLHSNFQQLPRFSCVQTVNRCKIRRGAIMTMKLTVWLGVFFCLFYLITFHIQAWNCTEYSSTQSTAGALSGRKRLVRWFRHLIRMLPRCLPLEVFPDPDAAGEIIGHNPQEEVKKTVPGRKAFGEPFLAFCLIPDKQKITC